MKETIKQAAERMYPINTVGAMAMLTRYELDKSNKQEGFIEGAKWQSERMYSEEEVLRIVTECKSYLSFGDEFNEVEWFEKFKKK